MTVPAEATAAIRALAPVVSYGWGMIPIEVVLGDAAWETAMFPKDGRYVVPLKDAVRRPAGIEPGDVVTLSLTVGTFRR